MANEGIEIEVYSYATPTVKMDTLNGRIDPTLLRELNGVGGGALKLSVSDPKIVANPALIASRNIVKTRVNGSIVGAFIIGTRKSTTIADGEKAQETYQVAGSGLKTWFDDAEVRPYGGLKASSLDDRLFNFASETGSWYKPASWITPYTLAPQGTGIWGAAPSDWPKNSAKWVWGEPYASPARYGDCYFRYEFTSATNKNYVAYAAADDNLAVYVDGVQLLVTDAKSSSMYKTSRIEFFLPAGNHVLAFRASNNPNFMGPAALVAALYSKTNNVETIITKSGDAGWKVNPYPAQAPGWTVGEVLLKLLNEAAARGVIFPTLLTPSFTALVDSNGTPWANSLDWSFGVGESLTSVISKLEELLCDIWIDPDTYALHMVPLRGIDRSIFGYAGDGVTVTSTPVIFERGKNLRQASTESRGKIKNSLSIKTADGWLPTPEQDAASTSAYGVVEGTLDTGASVAVSKTLAGIIFDQKATEEEGASYDVYPTDKIPLKDFFEGDWVLAPNERGLLVKRHVMSISVNESDTGEPLYSIEFDTIFQDNETRLSKAVAKLGGGGVGGSFSNASGGAPLGPVVVSPPPALLRIPLAPDTLAATSAGNWTPNGVTPYSEVTLTWGPVTLNTDQTTTIPTSYEVWGHLTSAGDDAYIIYATVTGVTAIIRPFVPGAQWTFKVLAKNDDRASAFSSELLHTMVGPTAVLAAPDIPVVASDKGILIVTWSGKLATLDPPPHFRYVFAQVAVGAGAYLQMGASLSRDARTIYIAGLTVGTAYKVRLIAVDGVGIQSAFSAVATHTLAGINLGNLDATVNAAVTAAQNAADAAQGTATNATTAAATAQTQANTAVTNAATAQTAASAANTAAATAQTTANNAASAASTADEKAIAASGLASTKAVVLYQTAAPAATYQNVNTLWIDTTNGANTPKKWVSGTTWAAVTDKAATDAASAAATANTAASTAQTAANAAQTTANTANTAAATAQTKADSAFSNAATAQTRADSAFTSASTAQTAANTAQTQANTATTNAATAQTQANTAVTNAATAQTKANTADTNALAASGLAATKGKVLYQTSAPTGVDANAQTLWINTTSNLNTPMKWVSGTTWSAVTDKTATDAAASAASANTAASNAQTQANTATTNAATAQTAANTANTAAATAQTQANLALANAATAQQKAVEAFNNAAAAQGTADSALSTANGKNKIIFSASAASGTGYVAGDIWFQKTGSIITGQWEFVSGAWAARTVDNAVIANLNAAKITAGTLDVARLGAKSITAEKMVLGDFSNMAPDPLLAYGNSNWNYATVVEVAGAIGSLNAIRITALGPGTYPAVYCADYLPINPGQEFYFSCEANNTGGVGLASVRLQFVDKNKANSIMVGSSSATATWGTISGVAVAPANTAYVRMWVEYAGGTSGQYAYFTNFMLRLRNTAELIVDGAIIANKLAAASVVAGKLAAASVVAENIQGGAVTAGKVAAGVITANEILAGTITGNELSVGTIETRHLSAGVGGELDISANSSVSILVGQVESVTTGVTNTADSLEEMQTYYKFGPAGAEVSTPSSPFALALRNDRIEMLENGNVVSYWNAGQMYVSQLIGEKVILGNHQIEKYSTGTVVRAL